MAPPRSSKNSRQEGSPSSLRSPVAKKQKGNVASIIGVKGQSQKVNTTEMANTTPMASAAVRSIDFSTEDGPPAWFLNYMEGFSKKMEEMVVTKLREQDEKIDGLYFDMNAMKESIKKLEDMNKILDDKVDNRLENRGRRNNLVLYGVPETGPRENTKEVVVKMLSDFVGIDAGKLNDTIQRCHRTPTTLPATGINQEKPRMIHMAISSFLDREDIRKQCIQKFKETRYEGRKIFVSEDFSKKVLSKRKLKMDQFKQLQKDGKKPFFVFPDIIKYRNEAGYLITAP